MFAMRFCRSEEEGKRSFLSKAANITPLASFIFCNNELFNSDLFVGYPQCASQAVDLPNAHERASWGREEKRTFAVEGAELMWQK